MSHITLVDKVSSALKPGNMEEDNSEDEDLSGNDDEEMSEDEDPDDAITLIQYQDEARWESLIRKNPQSSEVSPKKGRVEVESAFS